MDGFEKLESTKEAREAYVFASCQLTHCIDALCQFSFVCVFVCECACVLVRNIIAIRYFQCL